MGCCVSKALDLITQWDDSMEKLKMEIDQKAACRERHLNNQLNEMQLRLAHLEKGTVLAF